MAADRPALRCAVYTRKSTAAGLDQDFNSLDAQREACEGYIALRKHEGWMLLEEPFDDGGFSGANIERPAFQKLLDWVARRQVDVVVVYKVDRLSRSLVDFSQVMEHFHRLGVAFVSVTQHFSTTDAVGRLTLNMLMSFAEFEREMIADRIRDKVRAARRKGRWTGGIVPFGYRSEKGRLQVHEEEAVWVRRVFHWYQEGASALDITQRLNAEGVRPRSSKKGSSPSENPWTKALVLHLLKCRIYLGQIACQGEFVLAEHEGLLDLELFEAVQAKLALHARPQARLSRNPAYLIRGILVCAQCEVLMTSASSYRNDKALRYYRCKTRDKRGKDACPSPQVPAEALEDFVIAQVQDFLSDPEQEERAKALLKAFGLEGIQGDLVKVWESLTPLNRQRLMQALLQRVSLDGLNGQIRVEFRDPMEAAC